MVSQFVAPLTLYNTLYWAAAVVPVQLNNTELSEILDNESKLNEIGKNGFEYVTKNHDWNILSKKMIEKLKNIK